MARMGEETESVMSEKNIKVTEVTLEQAEVTDEMADWQPISSAPRDGTDILLGWSSGLVLLGSWLNIEYADIDEPQGWWAWNEYLGFAKVAGATHWMSLPAPPA